MFLGDIPILLYHSITEPGLPLASNSLALSANDFEQQMDYLYTHGYHCIPLQTILDSKHEGAALPLKAFALTFDDGYQDLATRAYPILQRYGFTATVFVVTERVGGKGNWPGETGKPLLTWNQIRALAGEGITFGSHTCNHLRLPYLPQQVIQQELAWSKNRLEDELGHQIHFLAYPYGHSNSRVQEMAVEIGYTGAFGQRTGRSGPYNIWRRMAHARESLPAFQFRLSRWYIYPTWLRQDTFVGEALRKVKHALFGPAQWPSFEGAPYPDVSREESRNR